MVQKRSTVDIIIDPAVYCVAAIALLAVPLKWVTGWLIACVMHELFHFLALKICRSSIWQIRIGMNGMQIVTNSMPPLQEAICAIAGPVGSGCCLLFSRSFPEAAVCAFVQGGFNLLPLYPLDGGRCLKAFLKSFLSEDEALKVLSLLRCVVITALCICCFYLIMRWRVGILPALIVVMIACKTKKSLH